MSSAKASASVVDGAPSVPDDTLVGLRVAYLGCRTVSCLFALVLAACSGSAREPATGADDRSPCALLCEHLAACGPPKKFPGVASCTRECEDEPRQRAGACSAPRLAYERCETGLACVDVRSTGDIDAAKRGPCGTEVAAVLACEPTPALEPLTFQF